MKLTVKVNTEKVVSYKSDWMPTIEKITQTLSPQATFEKFVKYLPNQNYKAVDVIGVYEDEKKVDKVDEYQSKIDSVLKPVSSKNVDYKALSEKQASEMSDMKNQLNMMQEQFKQMKDKIDSGSNRSLMESKAKELDIRFRSDISDDKLFEKIQEKEPEFKLN